MEITWHDTRLQDSIHYPYIISERLPKKYADLHRRDIYSLLASLRCFGYRIMTNQNSTVSISDEIRTFIPTVTRFCENTSQQHDLPTLFENIPPYVTKSRVIFLSTVLQNNAMELIMRTHDLSSYEHIIFVHPDDNDSFTIYYFVPSQRSLDLYIIGHNNMESITRICNTIASCFYLLTAASQLSIRQRLQVPTTFPHNNTVFTFILAMTLHSHANYLDLNSDTLAIQQLLLLPDMLQIHDASFGRLDSHSINRRSYPFFTKINPKEDDPDEVNSLGWSIVDVLGDGNCGYYSIILGLENHGISTYSPILRSIYQQPMNRSISWQDCIMNLRQDMFTKSASLVETIFSEANDHLSWRYEICPLSEDIDDLCDEFISPELEQEEYFDNSLATDTARAKYMMTPLWGYIVAACLLNIRFVVYIRYESWVGTQVTYKWQTIRIDPSCDLMNLFQAFHHLDKISDQQFHDMPTIEIMLTSGTKRDGTNADRHYRFLQRVLCDDYLHSKKVPNNEGTLRSFIRGQINQMQQEHMSDKATRNTKTSKRVNTATRRKQSMEVASRTKEANPKSPHVVTEASRDPTELPTVADNMRAATTERTESPTVTEKVSKRRKQSQEIAPPTKEAKPSSVLREACRERTESSTGAENVGAVSRERTESPTVAEKLIGYENLFNKLFRTKQLQHATPTKLYFKSSTQEFFMKVNVSREDPRIPCPDISIFDPKLVQAARELPDQWVGPSIGDYGFGDAPDYLCTKVVTIYQQHSNPYCLSYSLASALFYCDSTSFRIASEGLVHLGKTIVGLHFDAQIKKVQEYMETHVPLIGRPTLFGRRTNSHQRKLRRMTWDDLLLNVTPYPTVVIPKLSSGQATHAFCVVDDLIFDSTTPNALKLSGDSVRWLFHEEFPEIYQVIRFNRKVSPKGSKIWDRYDRQPQYHWDHPTKPNTNTT